MTLPPTTAAVGGAMAMLAIASAVAAAQPSLREVSDAWHKREASVATAKVTFEIHRQAVRRPGPRSLKGRAPEASAPIEVQRSETLVFSQGMWRYESSGNAWLEDPSVQGTQSFLRTWNGREFRSLLSINDEKRSGTVSPRPIDLSQLFVLHPVLFTVRPFACSRVSLGASASPGYSTTLSTTMVAGKPVWIVLDEQTIGNTGVVIGREWQVDPERAYSVVRYRSLVNHAPTGQIDITLGQSDSIGWVPREWRAVLFADGVGVTDRFQVTATQWSLNEPIDMRLFTFDFPVHTYVFDEAAQKEYFITGSGRRRYVSREELAGGLTYDRLIASESSLPLFRWSLIGAVLLLMLVIGSVCWLAIRRRHA